MAFEFNKCCICIDLRTGCLIIGYLNLIVEIVYILLGIVFFAGGIFVSSVSDQDNAEAKVDAQAVGAVMIVVSAIMLVFLFLFLAFTIVLLVGLHQYKRGHIKAYMIFALIFIVISIITFFAGFAGTIEPGNVVRQLLTILLSIYFLLVIRSYYLKMDRANKPAIYNTA